MAKGFTLTRDLYRQIKSMDRSSMERTLTNVYDMGVKDALENAAINLDMEKLRSELGTVNGVGDKRLEQIMEIIKRNIEEADAASQQDNTQDSDTEE